MGGDLDDWGSPAESLPAPSDAWAPTSSRVSDRRGRSTLADILKAELLPRLIAAPSSRAPASRALTTADPEKLARLLIGGRRREARALISARLASGAATRTVLLEDIAAAARRLGELWRDDDCDFADVTLATAGLRDLLSEIASDVDGPKASHTPSLMLATAPNETHALGPDMAAALFRQAGWRVARCGFEEGLDALSRQGFDAAGFSLSCDRYVDGLRRGLFEARRVSRNRRVKILLGGSLLACRPELAARVGADAGATGMDLAPLFPSTLLRTLRL